MAFTSLAGEEIVEEGNNQISGLVGEGNDLISVDPPSKIYMGFGFNPDLPTFGERLDILDYFSWMKRMQGLLSCTWTLFDASGFFILNRMPTKTITRLGKRPSGRGILEVILAEQEKPKRKKIMDACRARSVYLKRLLTITGINGTYIDSRTVFQTEAIFPEILEGVLRYFRSMPYKKPDLFLSLVGKYPAPPSQLYAPLEIAEAAFLKIKYGVQAKFGPDTEVLFDEAILDFMGLLKIPYIAFRCPNGPRRIGYLSRGNDVGPVFGTKTEDRYIKNTLETDQPYRQFVQGYVSVFQEPGESLLDCVIRLRDQLRCKEAEAA